MSGSAVAPALHRPPARWIWLASLAVPALVGSGPLAVLAGGSVAWLWAPLGLVYVLLPLADRGFGTDTRNPPEALLARLEADRFYRWITWALVPMLWAWFLFAAWFVMRHDLPWHGVLALVLATGVIGGFCINVGHELGHKRGRLEPWLAKLVLAPTGYGHFYVEHNRGHHRDVATPADPASARLGESLWRFLVREYPGALRRGWSLEVARMQAAGRPVLSLHNHIVQTTLLTLALYAALVWWLSPVVLLFVLPAAAWANFQLSTANYIEHYGLKRRQLADGRYEACKPEHSWNSDHRVSNWALFHLQRHSDHHANATRRYQCLRSHAGVPQLPSGYFGMFLLAYVPALWFRVMDARLLRAVANDPERINFDPRCEQVWRQRLAGTAAEVKTV